MGAGAGGAAVSCVEVLVDIEDEACGGPIEVGDFVEDVCAVFDEVAG